MTVLTSKDTVATQHVWYAGDIVEWVEVVHAMMQAVHAVLVAWCARQERGSAVYHTNVVYKRYLIVATVIK